MEWCAILLVDIFEILCVNMDRSGSFGQSV